jgi:AP-4 complex subunit epsilon-1
MDLIAFDSPFVSDPSEAHPDTDEEPDFEIVWNSFGDSSSSRGWYNASIDNVVRRIQGLAARRLQVISADIPPFLGK